MSTPNYPDEPPGGAYSRPTSTTDRFYNSLSPVYPWNDRSDCYKNSQTTGWKCSSNWGSCPGNSCSWFGVACPINYPYLLDGYKMTCDTFTSNIDTQAPSLNSSDRLTPFVLPVVGGTVTAEHINALRDSLLDEYSDRRWIITGLNRSDLIDLEQELVNEIIDAPSIQNLTAFIDLLINRGANQTPDPLAFTYDGYPNGDAFASTDSLSATPPLIGDNIDASVVLALMETVDNLRKACVCNNNCTCFGECTCNWNCKCNYSDIRLKEKVRNVRGKDIVNKLPAKSWKYTGIDGTHFSFIAQDVKKTLEDMGYVDQKVVEADANGILKISRPYELIAFLWDNMKDLNESFEELNKKVDKLINQ